MRRSYTDIIIPKENINKYNDSKFPPFLVEIGFCYLDDDKRYQLSSQILTNYLNTFNEMSIYNRIPETLKDLTFNDYDEGDDGTLSDSYKKKVESTLGYDLNSTAFKDQNSRTPSKNTKNKTSEKYTTNPRIGKTALEHAVHKCEYDSSHQTFLNKFLVPFMEPHHLIPMSAQMDFENNLDCIENIVSLCPNCHSGIHYGCKDVRHKILLKAYEDRIDKLIEKGLSISFDDLLGKYYK
ncbi:MAG: HNH endonuclease [Oscillospiraceae bacterium]